tara:strand:+ start:502 stop:1086 length:585 start_codon:yes stop_codon:yes gene_type:complete
MIIFRKLYNWTLDKSSKKEAPWFLSIVSFAESSFFPIPPDIILIPMILAKRTKAFIYASLCTLSSVAGGILGYIIGFLLFNSIGIFLINFYHLGDSVNEFKNYYNAYGAWIVIIAGFTPFPFKVITIASGLFQLNFIIFILCSIISRGARFYLVAGLLYLFGEKIKIIIDKYFNFITILFFILLIGSILMIKII